MNSRTKIDLWCEAVIEGGWLAALIVAPLFFNVFSSRVFEPDKISLVRTIMLVMVLAWLVKLAGGGPAWLASHNASDRGRHDLTWKSFWKIPFLVPILLLVVAYAISTLFSIAPFVSWWGSYQRLQGTYTLFSYVIIALLTMAHLRSPDQIRRLQHAVIVTSLPIAIYGVIQHYAIDPLPWGGDVTIRIAANAGNAIFLAAYLLMAIFLTLERIYSSFAFLLSDAGDAGRRLDLPSALAGGAYLFVLLVQLLAVFWTQSRGPWLGLFLGIYVFVLLTLSALRPSRWRALLGGWVGLGVLGIILIVLMNTSPAFNSLRGVPYIGRLTELLDQSSRTAQVRLLIWTGASEMVAPHDALIYPDGSTDAVNPVRTVVGYGPEAMWVAYNPFYPPELAYVESRNASPDRSHNETWDSLVITGVLGFIAYMSLFISIFYWALRWLGLLVNRRDKLLFGGMLTTLSVLLTIVFYVYDGSWRYLGVAVPAGLEAGLVFYIMLAPFLHRDLEPSRADRPRQLLIVAILATIAAHFVEIHFGIAIAATRTYFWVLTALLLTLGMRWATAEPFAFVELGPEENSETPAGSSSGKGRKRGKRAALPIPDLPFLPTMFMSDLLVFVTLVFIFTTNALGKTSAFQIFAGSFGSRVINGREEASPALLLLVFFSWLIASTLGLAVTALRRADGASLRWWLRGYALHALGIGVAMLLFGLFHARRLIPGVTGTDLDSQLNLVAGHFAIYTWVVILWILVAGTVYVWPALRDATMRVGSRIIVTALAAIVAVVLLFGIVTNVNVALVRADVIYKQGQQFDSQANWLSSVELYRRALEARTTEDHYMLFLGRALLEQAKQTPAEGFEELPPNPALNDVLALTPTDVSQMSRQQVLTAAEVVLTEAQNVNPLNTDHTANLARLYRTWADLSPEDPDLRQEMLDRSIEQYELAVTLSPNAAHLWNERGNAHLARGEADLAEEAYLTSLGKDPLYAQTYLLVADLWDSQDRHEEVVQLLESGIEQLTASNRHGPTAPIYSYLGVSQARLGDAEAAVDSNLNVLDLSPGNVGALRNLMLLYRDVVDLENALLYGQLALEATDPERINEQIQLRQVMVEIATQLGDEDEVLVQYDALRQLNPNDAAMLENLGALYVEREDWNRAIDVYQTLVQLQPSDYRHPYVIAQILGQVGQVDNALLFIDKAIELAPADEQTELIDFRDELSN